MQFLFPIWLSALAALSIPVIIHLWNIRPGKTLKVGSISLITEASKISSRSFKIQDILLLMLRCLLLALLALFLSAPVWQSYLSNKNIKGWVLIPKENFKQSYQKFKPTIDSLTAAGYEFHYFNQGFTKADIKKLLTDTLAADTTTTANYWSLISRLNTKLSPARRVYVFTPNNLGHFTGSKPAVSLNLQWRTYTPTDSTSKWVAAIANTGTNTRKVTYGNSNPQAVYFTEQSLPNGQEIKIDQNEIVVPDTSTLKIAIYTNKYAVDAHYLMAALTAAVNFTGQRAIIKQYTQADQIPAGQNWLFWLSEQAVSERLKSGNIFTYVNGKANTVNTSINTQNAHVALFKRVAATDKNGFILTDGFGNAVLSLKQQPKVNIYHFYTHFNPLWTDLVWGEDFPKIILKLIDNQVYSQPIRYDQRILSTQQIQPNISGKGESPALTAKTEQTDVSKYFWLALVLVFIAERLLSHKTKPITNG
ncbi:hypothetical protein FFF34_018015 [Inquilinus sp. KBS0705]|nr:hypothetical protein FFF34_018015 [Inquilinus sp. KBS0705]